MLRRANVCLRGARENTRGQRTHGLRSAVRSIISFNLSILSYPFQSCLFPFNLVCKTYKSCLDSCFIDFFSLILHRQKLLRATQKLN